MLQQLSKSALVSLELTLALSLETHASQTENLAVHDAEGCS